MKCTLCGKEITQQDKVCPVCGENNDQYVEPVVAKPVHENTNYSQYYQQQSNQNTVPNIHYTQNTLVVTEKKSSAALVCGIVGLFIAGIILGIIAIVLSNKPNASNPTAAKVLGILDIISSAIFISML